jgi:hypothetical protein
MGIAPRRSLAAAVAAAAAAICALTAAPAPAESSSVDAYGGQAAVLGKPGHHGKRAGTPARGAGGGGETTEGRSTDQAGGAAGSGPNTGSGPGSGAGSAGAGGSSSSRSSGAASGAASGTRAGGTGGQAGSASAAVPDAEQPLAGARGDAAAALPLSASDVLLVLAGLLCLIAIVPILRRLASHPAHGSETSR